MDFTKIKKIYMIGIKGVGMTMIAQYLAEQGIEIVGSDVGEKFITDEVLEKANIKVYKNFDQGNIPKDTDLIVYSTAYNAERNVEVAAALTGKIRTLTYGQTLGEIFKQKYGIAVCGSHGKTTTTAWLGYVTDKSKLSPSVMVASRVPQFDGSSLVGKSDYLIIEADEYQNKLQYFQPKAVLLNNIDYDHPDFFPTRESYRDVFVEFIKKISAKGFMVANFDDPIIRSIARVNCRGKVISYALDEAADYVAYDIRQETGKQYFKVKFSADEAEDEEAEYERSGFELGDFSISLAGRHNISNALAVIAACIELGIELVDIRTHLEGFTGTARRAEVMGKFRGATIIDDYAHHPTEIKTTLEGIRAGYAKQLEKSKLRVVFHPHTFTRTKGLFKEFSESFHDADEVIILDIFGSAREAQGGVHSKDLAEAIENKQGGEVRYIPTLKEAEDYLRDNIEYGDVVVLMGAGDVYKIGSGLLK